MLFFRSEELIAAWCRSRGVDARPIVQMDQLWRLAVTWYGSRLEPESRRPAPSEMRGIFESLRLHGDFWDPTTDVEPDHFRNLASVLAEAAQYQGASPQFGVSGLTRAAIANDSLSRGLTGADLDPRMTQGLGWRSGGTVPTAQRPGALSQTCSCKD